MPFRYDDATTPKGNPYLRVTASGFVSLAHAEELGAMVEPGARYHQARIMTVVEEGTDYSPESRKVFPTMNGKYRGLATVVRSPLVRAAINLMLRLVGDARDFQMFTSEAEALAWLDELA